MDAQSLNSEEIRGLLSAFAQDISRDLSLWVDNQKSLEAVCAPFDDPAWGKADVDTGGLVRPAALQAPVPVKSNENTVSRAAERSSVPANRNQAAAPQTSAARPSVAQGNSCFASFRAIRAQKSEVVYHTTEERQMALDMLYSRVASCRMCPLGTKRRDVMRGYGPADASVMFVAAGGNPAELDAGRMMPGEAGELLDKIMKAMADVNPEAAAERIFMTNVIKCACCPPRTMFRDTARTCLGFLREEVRIVSPDVIVIWGELAYRTMTGSDDLISVVRGQIGQFEGIPAIATHHPMEMLKNPNLKRRVWEDLKLALTLVKKRSK